MSDTQCTICRGVFPAAQIFTIDERAVCAGCKPVFLSRVLSGEPAPLEPMSLEARVMGFWETVGVGWKVIRSEWPAMLLLALLIGVPMNWALSLVPEPADDSFGDITHWWKFQQLAEVFLGVLITLGVAWIVRERLEGRRASLAGALAHAFRRWLSAIGTSWLEGLFLICLMLLLIVPGVIYAGYYTFSMIAVSLRRCGGTRALSYSKTLVKGRWWRVVGYAVGYSLPMLFLAFSLGIIVEFLPPWPHLGLASEIVIDLALRLGTVFLTVLFLNLDHVQRVREAAGEASILDRRLGQHHGA